MYVLFAALSALFYGVADFAGGFATRRSALLSVLALSQFAGITLALVFILAGDPGPPSASALLWGFLAGATGLVGLFTLYHGIATGIVAVVSPTSALVSALIPAIFGIVLGERPSPLSLVGAVLCLPAMLLLSWEPRGAVDPARMRKSIVLGLVAGTGFGCFFIALSRTGAEAGLWPVFAARVASLLLIFGYARARRQSLRPSRAGVGAALAAGMADMGANILFLLATRSGLLSIVSIISSLFPAPTVILARVFMKEALPPVRIAGLILALAGVALISLK
ncbi:MAG: DMT family transporter [Spirochaetota bacterium]